MEPITWAGLIAAALSGIIGNRADAAFQFALERGLGSTLQDFQDSDDNACDELQRSFQRAFLRAQTSIALERWDELTSEVPFYRGAYSCSPEQHAEIQWVSRKLDSLKARLSQIDKSNLVTTQSVVSSETFEVLLSGEDVLGTDTIPTVHRELVELASDQNAPSSYKDKISKEHTGIFERTCNYFSIEIKENLVVRDLLNSLLLTKINVNLSSLGNQQLTIDDLERSLGRMSRFMSDALKEDFIHIEDKIQEVISNQNSGFREVIEFVEEERKKNRDSDQQLRQKQSKPLFNQPNWNVKTVNQSSNIVQSFSEED
ncbi:MAG: hypothetical protein AAGN15_02570 [Cyanobacteria bacterium J06581_3]